MCGAVAKVENKVAFLEKKVMLQSSIAEQKIKSEFNGKAYCLVKLAIVLLLHVCNLQVPIS